MIVGGKELVNPGSSESSSTPTPDAGFLPREIIPLHRTIQIKYKRFVLTAVWIGKLHPNRKGIYITYVYAIMLLWHVALAYYKTLDVNRKTCKKLYNNAIYTLLRGRDT